MICLVLDSILGTMQYKTPFSLISILWLTERL